MGIQEDSWFVPLQEERRKREIIKLKIKVVQHTFPAFLLPVRHCTWCQAGIRHLNKPHSPVETQSLMRGWKTAFLRLQDFSVKQRALLPISFVRCFSLYPFPKPQKLFPQQDSLCLLLGSSACLWPFPCCYLPPQLPTQPFSPDLRRKGKAISCIHLGMILQNLTLVLISVQLCLLFSWICWCFIYVGHAGCCTRLVREVCTPAGAFLLLHLCHTFVTQWKAEARRFKAMSACDGCEAQLCAFIFQKKHYFKLICHLQNHSPDKCFVRGATSLYQDTGNLWRLQIWSELILRLLLIFWTANQIK